jgi:hypothetical protein
MRRLPHGEVHGVKSACLYLYRKATDRQDDHGDRVSSREKNKVSILEMRFFAA